MRLLALAPLVLLLLGCDNPGRLIIQNQTDNDARVRVLYKEANKQYTWNFDLKASGPNSRAEKLLGFGWHWSDQNIREFVKRIERLDVVTQNDSLGIVGDTALFELFRKGRPLALFKDNNVLFKKRITLKIR